MRSRILPGLVFLGLLAIPSTSWAAEADKTETGGARKETVLKARRAQLARAFGVDEKGLDELDRRAAEIVAKEQKQRAARRGPLAAGPAWTALGPTFSPTFANPIGSAKPGEDDTGLIAAIAAHPTTGGTIIVGTSGGGLWKTVDGGDSWRAVAENLPTGSLNIGAVAYAPSNPSRVYAGSACGDNSTTKSGSPDGSVKLGFGLLVSNDGGDSWQRVEGTAPGDFFWRIDVDPTNADTLLAGVDRGLVRSTDAGKTWATVISSANVVEQFSGLTDPGNVQATSIARSPSSPTTIFAAVYLSGNLPGVIFKSTDNGATFTAAGRQGMPPEDLTTRGRIQLAVHPTDPNHVYALVATQDRKQADFARSTDGGQTWQAMGLLAKKMDILDKQANFCNVLFADPKTPGTLWAGGLDMWRSTDEGENWTKISDWSPPTGTRTPLPYLHSDQHTMAFGADGKVFVGNDGGIFERTGSSWKGLNAQINSFLVDEICTNPSGSIVIAGNQDNGTAILRENGRWDQIGGGDGYGCRVNPTNDLIFTLSVQNNGILPSTDGGKTLRDAEGLTEAGGTASSFRTVLVQHPTVASRIFTYTKHKIWRSNDDGLNWAQVSENMPIIKDIVDLTISPVDGNRLLLVDAGGQVVESTDEGASWTILGKYPLKGSASAVRADRTDPNKIYVSSKTGTAGRERVWVTPDKGQSWTPLSKTGQPDGIPDLPLWTFEQDPVNAQVLWAGSYIGVYRSGDGGQTWGRHGDGLPNVPVTAMAFPKDGAAVFAGTSGRGIWRVSTAAATLAPLTPTALAAPTPDFSFEPVAPHPGRLVTFTDKSTGNPTKWLWDFSDGTTSREVSPEHVFKNPGTYNVTLTVTNNAIESKTVTKRVTVAYATTGTGDALTYLLPVIVRTAGAGGTSFSTELTLTNRSGNDLSLVFFTKDGSATYTMKPGQEIYPDVFEFLKTAGLFSPNGSLTTTLRIESRGSQHLDQFGAQVRVTTPPSADLVAQGIAGRFGLAFQASPLLTGASKEAVVYSLQQVGEAGKSGTRSNLACAHAGGGGSLVGSIKLEVTYHDGDTGHDHASKDTFDLGPFAFDQKNTPLASRGIKNGWATIRRVGGNDQFVCYATVIDNLNGDSSYVSMVPTDTKSKKSDAMLPVIVDTGGFKSELTIANRTSLPLGAEFVVITQGGETEYGEIDVPPMTQVVYPDAMAAFRALGLKKVTPGSVASVYFTFEQATAGGVKLVEGEINFVSATDVYVGARTYATKAGGLFGLAYPVTVVGDAADTEAYVYGLQQSGERGKDGGTRSNLAVVHALDGKEEPLGLEITYYDSTGRELGKDAVTLKPGQWTQFNTPLARYAGVTQGYARIVRTSGSDEFVAYGVLNDQANDDGSFVPMVIP